MVRSLSVIAACLVAVACSAVPATQTRTDPTDAAVEATSTTMLSPAPEASAAAAPTAAATTSTAPVLRSTAPTQLPTATPPPTGPQPRAYTTLPPGATLPSEAQCAAEIVRDTWEPRPANTTANRNNAWVGGFRLRASYIGSIDTGYEQRVTGNFTGTTDQVIRWGACKWGFDEQDIRAQAVTESTWRQSHLGDCGRITQPETKGCASVGLMQIKGANIPATHPGTWPAALTSTAFNVDYALAVRRLCFEGKETWMRKASATYAAGDVWGCIGRWYSGSWRDAAAERYITEVRATLNARPWLSPTF
jgi:hypothetical protein